MKGSDTMSANPHYFWAVRLPDETKRIIHEEMKKLEHVFRFKRWVHMEDYHITLAFLGSVDEPRLAAVIELVGNAIKEEESFPLRIEGLDLFGNQLAPRIFWAAVNEEERLFRLQQIIHQTCMTAGFTLEDRPYHPHITLARKWSADEAFARELLVRHNPFQDVPLSFEAKDIVLYKTDVEKAPKYEPVVSLSIR